MRRFLLIVVGLASLVWVGCDGQFEIDTVCNQASDCASRCTAELPVPECLVDEDECVCHPDFGTGGTGRTGGMSAPCDAPDDLAEFVPIEDTDFEDADWDQMVVLLPPPGAETTGTSAGKSLSGGADGVDDPYRNMTHQMMNPDIGEANCSVDDCSFTFEVLHQYKGQTYDTSDGAIAYIDYSEHHIITEPAFEGAAVAWRFAVWQDGNRYNLPSEVFRDLEWTAENRCRLTAADFTPTGLNFEGGGPVTFGYIRANTNTQPGSTQRNVHGIDNFRVVIVTE